MSRVHLLFVVTLTTLIVASHGKPAAHEKDTEVDAEVKDLLQALKRFLGEEGTNIEATVSTTQANVVNDNDDDDDDNDDDDNSGRAASTPRMDLKITADNILTGVYIDGQRVPQSQLPNANRWEDVDTVSIPAETQVIAVSARDIGVVAGILASVGGDRFVTNSRSWSCVANSSSISPTWMNVDFDDSAWPQAVVVGNNPDKWHSQRGAISSSAQWIWTRRFLQGDVDAEVLCRGRLNQYFSSCLEILNNDAGSPSGEYTIKTSTQLAKVYCEMGLNGGGYTFLHPSSIPRLSDSEIQAMFTDRSNFLIRVRKADGTQPYGVLQQLDQYRSYRLRLSKNNITGYAGPNNAAVIGQPFLFYAFLPLSTITKGTVHGIKVNGANLQFSNCDANPSSYIALFPNFAERAVTEYRGSPWPFCDNLLSGSLTMNPSHRVIPDEYFMFFETQWGGCGCYAQADNGLLSKGIISVNVGFK